MGFSLANKDSAQGKRNIEKHLHLEHPGEKGPDPTRGQVNTNESFGLEGEAVTKKPKPNRMLCTKVETDALRAHGKQLPYGATWWSQD